MYSVGISLLSMAAQWDWDRKTAQKPLLRGKMWAVLRFALELAAIQPKNRPDAEQALSKFYQLLDVFKLQAPTKQMQEDATNDKVFVVRDIYAYQREVLPVIRLPSPEFDPVIEDPL